MIVPIWPAMPVIGTKQTFQSFGNAPPAHGVGLDDAMFDLQTNDYLTVQLTFQCN